MNRRDMERLIEILPDILEAAIYTDACDCKSCRAINEAYDILDRVEAA